MNRDHYQRKYEELRKRAESRLANEGEAADRVPLNDVHVLQHEVSVQHIELEMQHDELIKVHHELGGLREKAEHGRARYQQLFDVAAVGMVVLTDRGLITECNATFARVTEQASSSLVGRTLAEFVAPDDRLNFDVLFKQETLHPSGRRISINLKTKKGNLAPIALTVAKLDRIFDNEAYLVTLVEGVV